MNTDKMTEYWPFSDPVWSQRVDYDTDKLYLREGTVTHEQKHNIVVNPNCEDVAWTRQLKR